MNTSNQEFLKNLLENLKKPIPSQWRVQSYSKNKPIASLIAYIDARQCMDLLDEHAIYGWGREHYEIDGKNYCSVTITLPDGTVQKRSDCGTSNKTEKEKSESSDSFKRACVNWGIGRFLYDLPLIYIDTDVIKTDGNYPKLIDKNKKPIADIDTYCNEQCGAKKINPTTRPLMSEAQLATVIARVKNGDKGAFYKSSLHFQLTEHQFNSIKNS